MTQSGTIEEDIMSTVHILVFLALLFAVVRITRLDDERHHDRHR
jgi:hypothetical protein